MTVVAVVLPLVKVETSEAAVVPEESVLVLWMGDSGGVNGISCGLGGADRGESKAEVEGGVGIEKLFKGCVADEGGR